MIETEAVPTLTQLDLLRYSINVLANRAARWVTLLLSFSLFAAAVWYPDWKRLAAASAFTVLVHVPLWMRKEKANGV